MSIFSIPPLISSMLFLLLGVFVFLKNKKSVVNATFSLICLSTVWWQFTWFILFNTKDEFLASILVRVGYMGIILIPITFFHFFITFLDKNYRLDKYLLYFSYLFGLLFEISLWTSNYFISGYYKFFWGFYPKASILHPVYLLVLTIISLRILYLLLYSLKQKDKLSPYKYYQIKYFFIALIFYIFSASDFIVNYGVEIYPVGFIFIIVFLSIVGYSIIKYRLMDVRIIIRGSSVYLLSVALVVAMAIAINKALNIFFTVDSNVSYLLILIFSLTIFSYVEKYFYYLANKYLFYSFYNSQETINNLSRELTYYTDLKKIIDLIVNSIKKTMQLERAGVLLLNKENNISNYQIAKVVGFNINNGISLVKDNFLTQYLQKTKKPLVRDELLLLSRDSKNSKEQKGFLELHDNMEHIEASLCLPLLAGGKLIGIIVLGGKISGDAYTQEDLTLLATLSLQAGIAIDNAKLYQEVDDFNKNLKNKVDEQTKEIKAKADHLSKLLEMRSEFLDIASHQLKTPVSVILGTISMFREGSMEKLSKEQQHKFIDNIFFKAKKLGTIISDILRASEMDTDEFMLDPKCLKATQLADVITEACDGLKQNAEEKKIELKWTAPKNPVSNILTDPDFLEQAITNLVDNAIKYTAKGSVSIDLSENNDRVIMKVSDTGIGIPKTDQAKMFHKFNRAKNAVNMYTDGSGLGLFIVKKIVEAHQGGTIAFESTEGQGTTFTISFQKYIKNK
ncbi:MAG: ATP-binding protein [bacterium]